MQPKPHVSPAQRFDQLQGEIRRIASQLATPASRFHPGLDSDLALLSEFETVAAHLNRHEERANAVWMRSFLLENRGLRQEAIDAIEAVREGRDRSRSLQTSWQVKAGLTGLYPALAVRLATLYSGCEPTTFADPPGPDVEFLRAAQLPKLFEALEWAKGRALADEQGNRPASLEQLRQVLAGTRTHYFSLMLDDRCTFAVLVTAGGQARAYRLKVGKSQVSRHAREDLIRPEGRGKKQLRSDPDTDWRQVLQAIAAPVDQAIADELIMPGDTLLISPHDLLHLFPLHELPASGTCIGERVAVVRVHSAADVVHRAQSVPIKPRSALMIRVPTLNEAADPQHSAAFAGIVAIIESFHLRTETRNGGDDSTAESVLPAFANSELIHFMCHGGVSEAGPVLRRPYLLLSAGRTGSVSRSANNFAPEGSLTVQMLLDETARRREPMTTGAHVTLQACVSGQARTNRQGDAIGLEWAFLLDGAASTLGSHWHVDWPDAAMFCAEFYEQWLGGSTRAQAWFRAGEAVRSARPGSHWAAFSLTGEWR